MCVIQLPLAMVYHSYKPSDLAHHACMAQTLTPKTQCDTRPAQCEAPTPTTGTSQTLTGGAAAVGHIHISTPFSCMTFRHSHTGVAMAHGVRAGMSGFPGGVARGV
jgi:hypothetical protein